MRCRDAATDRLQVAKTLLGELAESAVGDRFGIAFAGTPVYSLPQQIPGLFGVLCVKSPAHADWRITSGDALREARFVGGS